MDNRRLPLLFVIALVGIACGGQKETATFRQAVAVPAQVQSAVTCTTSGASVTIAGELELGGVGARIVMRNNQKGTHERTDDLGASVVLIGADTHVEIPTDTLEGEPIRDPVVSVQLLDGDGNPVSGEIVLGSCAEGTLTLDAPALLPALVTLDVAVAGCANNPGPTVTIAGAVTFSGLQQRLLVRDGSGGEIAGEVVLQADIVALRTGDALSVPKQPVNGGVGGNPWIWIQLHDAEGEALTDEILMGRCVQLAG